MSSNNNHNENTNNEETSNTNQNQDKKEEDLNNQNNNSDINTNTNEINTNNEEIPEKENNNPEEDNHNKEIIIKSPENSQDQNIIENTPEQNHPFTSIDIIKQNYCMYDLDNSFVIFKPKNGHLYIVYPLLENFICFDLIDEKIIATIKKAHEFYVLNFRYLYDPFLKKDLIITISGEDNNIKLWDIETWECLINIKANSFGIMFSSCFLYDSINKEYYIVSSNCTGINFIQIFDFKGNKIKDVPYHEVKDKDINSNHDGNYSFNDDNNDNEENIDNEHDNSNNSFDNDNDINNDEKSISIKSNEDIIKVYDNYDEDKKEIQNDENNEDINTEEKGIYNNDEVKNFFFKCYPEDEINNDNYNDNEIKNEKEDIKIKPIININNDINLHRQDNKNDENLENNNNKNNSNNLDINTNLDKEDSNINENEENENKINIFLNNDNKEENDINSNKSENDNDIDIDINTDKQPEDNDSPNKSENDNDNNNNDIESPKPVKVDHIYYIDSFFDEKLNTTYVISCCNEFIKSFNYNTNTLYHIYLDKTIETNIHGNDIIDTSHNDDIVRLFETCNDGYVRIWDFHLGILLNKIKVCDFGIKSICLWDENHIFVGCDDTTIKMIDITKNEIIHVLSGHMAKVCCLKIIEHEKYGKCIISKGWGGDYIKLWKKKDNN